MSQQPVHLPDGKLFEFWDDRTQYRKTYHVACESPFAADHNPGTPDKPFKTINHAAGILAPGEKVVIHGGHYRERVVPVRGGTGPDAMIAYEAAPGEQVVISGSRVWAARFVPSNLYRRSEDRTVPIWMANPPTESFIDGYNPFLCRNMPAVFFNYNQQWTPLEKETVMMFRGSIFFNGEPLRQVFWPHQLQTAAGAFWVHEGREIHFRLPGDADPDSAQIEITVQEQVFAPREYSLGYVRLKGLVFEHSAEAMPLMPQRGMVSTTRGHHWIIERCEFRHAHVLALDIGAQDWANPEKPCGSHVVRGNSFRWCGVCGLAGFDGVHGSLVEENVFEHIGGLPLERLAESAAIKFHLCRNILIRRNVIRHLTGALGIWMDCSIVNCRITGNILADIPGHMGGILIECAHERNLIDGNVLWDIRGYKKLDGTDEEEASGIDLISGENAIVANNLFGRVRTWYAVYANIVQKDRIVDNRAGLGRRHRVFNNIFVECPRRIYFSRGEDNQSDGNLFDGSAKDPTFEVQYPEPRVLLNLQGWQEYYGLDKHSALAEMDASLDVEKLVLRLKVHGGAPRCQSVPEVPELNRANPGPFTPAQWTQITSATGAEINFAENIAPNEKATQCP